MKLRFDLNFTSPFFTFHSDKDAAEKEKGQSGKNG